MAEPRLSIKERREKCGVVIPADFLFYKTPLGVIPPYAKVDTDIPNVWAHLRPDIIEWIEENVSRKADIRIENHWTPRGAAIVLPNGQKIQPKALGGKLLVFETQHDAALFKLFWV